MSVEPAPPALKFATPGTSAPSTHASLLPEMEHVLTSLTSHRSVLGYMVLSRAHPVTIIRHSGVVFEGEQGRKYAQCISRIAQSVQTGLQEVSGDPDDTVSIQASWQGPRVLLI